MCVCFEFILIKSLDYCINTINWSINKNSWLHPSYNKNSRTLINIYQMSRKDFFFFIRKKKNKSNICTEDIKGVLGLNFSSGLKKYIKIVKHDLYLWGAKT